jgi:hypothetical protein
MKNMPIARTIMAIVTGTSSRCSSLAFICLALQGHLFAGISFEIANVLREAQPGNRKQFPEVLVLKVNYLELGYFI